jgi:hypothetical protein
MLVGHNKDAMSIAFGLREKEARSCSPCVITLSLYPDSCEEELLSWRLNLHV